MLGAASASSTKNMAQDSTSIGSSRPSSRGRNGLSPHPETFDPAAPSHRRTSTASSGSSPSSLTNSTAATRSYIRPTHGMRRDSTASNFSTLSEVSQPWTRADIGLNAISGVLNNPNKKPSTTKPTKTDIPPVPSTPIRKVKASEFESYIKHITPVFERYQNNRALSGTAFGKTSGTTDQITSPRSPFASSHDSLAVHLQPLSLSALTPPQKENERHEESVRNPYSIPDLPEVDEPVPSKPILPETPSLDTVPRVFFDPDFNFENPRTFDLVCELTGTGVDSATGEKSTTTSIVNNSILQEKLSHYLDTVEIHLMTEISRRSTSFFEALSNLQALHSQTLECVSQIHVLRAQLARIDHTQSKQGLEVVRLKRRRRNLGLLHNGIRMVKEIRSTQPMIQILLTDGNYFGALDMIDSAQMVLRDGDMRHLNVIAANKPVDASSPPDITATDSSSLVPTPRSLDIRGVLALVHFSGQLTEMRKMIGKMLENDFVTLLLNDFRYRIGKLDVATLLMDLNKVDTRNTRFVKPNFNKGINPLMITQVEKEQALQEKLLPLIQGLLRTNRASIALQTYREQMIQEIKNIIKSQYPPPVEQVTAAAPTSTKKKDQMAALTNQVREMEALTFYKMLSYIYAFLLGALQRDSLYHQLILRCLRQTEAEGIVQNVPSDLMSDSDSILETASTREKRSGYVDSDGRGRFSEDGGDTSINTPAQDPIADSASDNMGFSLGAVSPDPPHSGNNSDAPRVSMRSALASPPLVGAMASLRLEDDSGQMSANSVVQLFRQLETESEEIVFAVADLAHSRCAKLMGMRSEQTSKLLPQELYRLLKLTWSFVIQSELLSGYMCYGLRTAILSQSKSFLLHFHTERTSQLALAVGEDQWIQVEVPWSSQSTVNEILSILQIPSVEARTRDFTMKFNPLALAAPPRNEGDDQDEDSSVMMDRLLRYKRRSVAGGTGTAASQSKQSQGGSRASEDQQPSIPPTRVLTIQDEVYFVVACSLMLIDILAEYLDILNNIPALTTDVMQRIIELLKLFNSRTCQVILGAGAMRSAGLKNITAKHLALASQSLSVFSVLIPSIKEWIKLRMSDKQVVMLTEFDRILRDYQEHQNEIHAKLVAIMSERLNLHIRSMTNPSVVDYDALNKQPTSSAGSVNAFVEGMIKDVTTLHKVLSRFLPANSMRRVIDEVLQMFTTRLEDEIQKLPITTPLGKTRLQADMAFFGQKLGPLDANGIIGTRLMRQVKDLQLAEKRSLGNNNSSLSTGNGASAKTTSTNNNKPTQSKTSFETTASGTSSAAHQSSSTAAGMPSGSGQQTSQ
ncbi:hypothetical protein BGW41_006640 [Actinomortierella wolfii]|nr:hypothetical protein BGW41_006640 [Actinomortierella wolfii]